MARNASSSPTHRGPHWPGRGLAWQRSLDPTPFRPSGGSLHQSAVRNAIPLLTCVSSPHLKQRRHFVHLPRTHPLWPRAGRPISHAHAAAPSSRTPAICAKSQKRPSFAPAERRDIQHELIALEMVPSLYNLGPVSRRRSFSPSIESQRVRRHVRGDTYTPEFGPFRDRHGQQYRFPRFPS